MMWGHDQSVLTRLSSPREQVVMSRRERTHVRALQAIALPAPSMFSFVGSELSQHGVQDFFVPFWSVIERVPMINKKNRKGRNSVHMTEML